MPDDDIKITEEETPQVSPDEVLQYMNDMDAGSDEQEPSDPSSRENSVKEKEQEVPNTTVAEDEQQTSFYFTSDETFASSQLDDVDKELFIELNKAKIEVTREDKTMYLKAVLNDVPVRLDVPIAGQRVLVSCRALTAQEKILVPIGCLSYISEHPSYPAASVVTLIQMARIAMQITAVDQRPVAYIQLHDPLSNLEEEAKKLIPAVFEKVQDMNAARYNFLTQALNVFEHKLARLSDAAFNQDFWDPVATD